MSLEVVTFSVSEVRLAAFLGVDAMRTVPDLTLEPAGVLMLAENFERLFREKIQRTKQAAEAAKAALGWH